MKLPLISIITVCYNSVDTIERTIRSVLEQNYSDIEYIIIDGGSSDGTVEVIKNYADRISYWVSEPDRGIYDAMNKGIAKATGEWIHFRNSGDYFLSRRTVSEVFKEEFSENVAVVHGDCYYVYPDHYIRKKPAILSKPYNQDMPVLHPATFVRSRLHKETLFDLCYRSAADYNFFYQLCKKGCKFQYVPIIVSTFATGGFSANWERAFWEDRRIQERTNSFWDKVKVFFEFVRRKLWKKYKAPKLRQTTLQDGVIYGQVEYDY